MLKKYTKPYPTIGKLVAGKDYDYVSYRGYDEKRNLPPVLPDGTVEGEFCGCFKVVNGKIIPLDGDSYDAKETVIASEEWSMPDEGIEKGLTVIVEMEFVPSEELQAYFDSFRKKKKSTLKAVDIKWDVTDYDDDEFDDKACEVLESLPTEMDIPKGMTDPDEISDWLSDETGFCHDGFRIIDKNGNDVNLA